MGNLQKFLIESLGEVKTSTPEKLPDDSLPRSWGTRRGSWPFTLQEKTFIERRLPR